MAHLRIELLDEQKYLTFEGGFLFNKFLLIIVFAFIYYPVFNDLL